MDRTCTAAAARAHWRRFGQPWSLSSTRCSMTRACRSLGYMNDLLYIAAAIAPASFNDVTLGNNVSSFALGGAFSDADDRHGDHADRLRLPGRPRLRPDDRTGLAKRPPSGTRIDRYRPRADVVRLQSRLDRFQRSRRLDQRRRPEPSVPDHVRRRRRLSAWTWGPTPSASSARHRQASPGRAGWPGNRCKADFDAALVIMFDKQAQGTVAQAHLSSGEALSVSIDAASAAGDPGRVEQPVRLCRFPLGRRCGAGGDSGDHDCNDVVVGSTSQCFE